MYINETVKTLIKSFIFCNSLESALYWIKLIRRQCLMNDKNNWMDFGPPNCWSLDDLQAISYLLSL